MRTEHLLQESTAAAGSSRWRRWRPPRLLAMLRWVVDRILRLFGLRRGSSDHPNIYPFY